MGAPYGRTFDGRNGSRVSRREKSGGRTIGILPFGVHFDPAEVSEYVDFPVFTGLGDGRNAINVLTSRVVLVCGIGSGTASEAALAIKAKKPVILVSPDETTAAFFQSIAPNIAIVHNAASAIERTKQFL